MAKLTTEEFIKRAREVHGDKYDYSKVEYVNTRTKVCIVCPEHGEFLQRPSDHLIGHECPQCGKVKNIQSRQKKIDLFIEEAKEVHGDKYDYSKVEYVNTMTKVRIVCPEHGEFLQRPLNHLNGQGCPQCVGREKLNTKEFIKRAREVHGDKYDYSKVEYVNNRTKVRIVCPEHGEFLQRASGHLSGKGCKKCSIDSNADSSRKTKEWFIEEAQKVHGDKYDYSKVKYVNNATKVAIICPEHGEFLQRPAFHQRGAGCPQCAGYVKLTTQDFITRAREVHGNKYDYSKVEYTNMFSKVTIICPEHGTFQQGAKDHLDGAGCPICNESKGENAIRMFFNKHNIEYITQKTFPGCRYKRFLPFDFFLPQSNICIEYQGLQHYEADEHFGGKKRFEYRQRMDNIKREYCKKNGIRLIEIRYDEDVEEVLKKLLLRQDDSLD